MKSLEKSCCLLIGKTLLSVAATACRSDQEQKPDRFTDGRHAHHNILPINAELSKPCRSNKFYSNTLCLHFGHSPLAKSRKLKKTIAAAKTRNELSQNILHSIWISYNFNKGYRITGDCTSGGICFYKVDSENIFKECKPNQDHFFIAKYMDAPIVFCRDGSKLVSI